MIEFSVNGEARQFDGDPEMPLLWYLRDSELQLTGSKYGCGIGLCGCLHGPCRRSGAALLHLQHGRCRRHPR